MRVRSETGRKRQSWLHDNRPCARFALEVTGRRHLIYYILRLLVRSLPIALVSWFSFFLRDTGKRVDLASGNLLLFIAFNFTIGNVLPRLGYVTVGDAALAGLFCNNRDGCAGERDVEANAKHRSRRTIAKARSLRANGLPAGIPVVDWRYCGNVDLARTAIKSVQVPALLPPHRVERAAKKSTGIRCLAAHAIHNRVSRTGPNPADLHKKPGLNQREIDLFTTISRTDILTATE